MKYAAALTQLLSALAYYLYAVAVSSGRFLHSNRQAIKDQAVLQVSRIFSAVTISLVIGVLLGSYVISVAWFSYQDMRKAMLA